MILPPRVRQLALTAHVGASVGWLGAVTAFLALAIAGLVSDSESLVRGAYVASDVITRFVIVPLGFAALLSGLVQALGTTWGLFRHYWVVIKLVLTVIATLLLLLHTRPIGAMADVAADAARSIADFRHVGVQLVADAGAALALLLVTTGLSVFKPRGLTRYGWRKQREEVQAVAQRGR